MAGRSRKSLGALEVTCLELAFRKADGTLAIGQVPSRIITLAGETVQLSILRDVTLRRREEEERPHAPGARPPGPHPPARI